MKFTILLTAVLLCVFNSNAMGRPQVTCNDESIIEGVDILPWSVAKPFPWDNISGYWKLGDDSGSFVKARVQSTTSSRKILSLQVYGDGICSKPFAKGTGYIEITEKNVVRALLLDNQYRYQMKLGLFDPRDIATGDFQCIQRIMAVSMQIVGRADVAKGAATRPIDPSMTETHNMLLKKVAVDPSTFCEK